MDTRLLSIFVDVVQAGSFAEAARWRDVDPSSISRAIATLEAGVGARLFQRTTRRLVPTEAGARFFDRVEPLARELEEAGAEARDMVAEPAGTVRVTASVAFGVRRLVPMLRSLREAYPALVVDLVLTDAVLDLVAERIDVAIRLGGRLDSRLVGLPLLRTRYRVCASPEYVARRGTMNEPRELSDRDCLVFDLPGYRSAWRFRDAAGAETEVPVKPGLVISNALGLHRAALDGLGPVLLADWLVADDVASGALVDLFPHHEVTATDFETAAWLLYPSRAYVPLKVRAFIDHARSHLQGAGATAVRNE
jgi:DNA-binding transcriptional LysR family regulator